MAVQRVKRVYVIAHAPARDRVVTALHTAGLVHLEAVPEEERGQIAEPLEIDTRDLDRRIGELETAIDYLAKFSAPGEERALHPQMSPEGFARAAKDPAVDATLAETRRIQTELAEIEVRRSRLLNAAHHLEPWQSLPVPLEWLQGTPSTTTVCGVIPARAVEPLRETLAGLGCTWILEEVSTEGGRSHFVLVALTDECPDLDRNLREAGFQPMLFPASHGTVPEALARIAREVASISATQAELQTRASALAAERVKLMAAYDDASALKQRAEGLATAAATRESIVLAGWAKSGDLPRLSEIVECNGEATLLARDPNPDEEPPVALLNQPAVAPCQAVTGLYGMPKYRELDPTPLLAPFFVASFAIAVGEGGYGVVLAVLAKLGRRFLRLSEGGRHLLDLLFYCGIATFVAGMLMGSFFAIDFSKLPPSLTVLATLHDKLLLLNPMEKPLIFLGFVLALGFLQVWTGVLIGAIVQWRSGDRGRAVVYSGGWLTLLPLTALLLIQPVVGGVPVLYPWLGAAVAVFVGAGLGIKSVGGRIGSGLFALYGITGFFGDVLSYSRLFALGLATGVMASVINILANEAKNSMPVVGWIGMVLILVIGHPVNIAINALGAFVHSARLQFVEFFTKFFEGGGRRFEPFARRFRYMVIAEGKEPS